MPTGAITLAVVAERIENLRSDICQLVEQVRQQTEKMSKFELEYERRHNEVVKTTEANTRDIGTLKNTLSEQAKEIKDLKDIVTKQSESINDLKDMADKINKLVWALLIPLLLSGFTFFVSLLTHRLAIVIP